MTVNDKVKQILECLAEEYGDETFVSDGYGYYYDALEKFSELLAEVQTNYVLESCEAVNLPQKDAGRKLSSRLKELGKQRPLQDIVNEIHKNEEAQTNYTLEARKECRGNGIYLIFGRDIGDITNNSEVFEVWDSIEKAIQRVQELEKENPDQTYTVRLFNLNTASRF